MSTDQNAFKRVTWGDEHNPSDDDDEFGQPLRPATGAISPDDLELLTLAARAIGAVQVEAVESEQWLNLHFPDGQVVYGWNPLQHSDDMLNLSALLRIDIKWVDDVAVFANDRSESTTYDPSAAARRAVTRAAAEIAKAR